MYLSLCLIVKDENSYLQEWLDYHILLGVEHFWIYDNESSTPVKTSLGEYIDKGLVTVHTIKGRGMQLAAYDHCVQFHGQDSTWIGFIDTDEFIVPRSSTSLVEYLKPFETYGGLAISSLFFGHGGNKKRPSSGQIRAYKIRTPDQLSLNRLVKMIIQPAKVLFPISPHSFLFKQGNYCVNEKGSRVDAQQFPCHVDRIQVNHYFTRSEEEWHKKLTRGRGDSGDPYADDRWVKINKYSSVEDTCILDLLQKILHKPVRNPSNKKSKTGASENYLLVELHKAALKFSHPAVNSMCDEIAIPRKEMQDYLDETNHGIGLLNSGEIQEAREFYLEQIQKYPFDVMRYANYASVSIQCKEFPSAWSALAQAWRIAPQSLYVLLCMIDYFYATGDFHQVEKTCLIAEAQGNLEPVSVAIKALAQWKQGKKEEAFLTAGPVLTHLSDADRKNPIFRELSEKVR